MSDDSNQQFTVADTFHSPGGYQWDLMSDGTTIRIQSISYETNWATAGRGPWSSAQAAFNDLGVSGIEPESEQVKAFVGHCQALSQLVAKVKSANPIQGTVESAQAWVTQVADALAVAGMVAPAMGALASELKGLQVRDDQVAQKVADVALNVTDFDGEKLVADCLASNSVPESAIAGFNSECQNLIDAANGIKHAVLAG